MDSLALCPSICQAAEEHVALWRYGSVPAWKTGALLSLQNLKYLSFLLFCSGLDFIDYIQNTPNILVFGLQDSLRRCLEPSYVHTYLITLYWH